MLPDAISFQLTPCQPTHPVSSVHDGWVPFAGACSQLRSGGGAVLLEGEGHEPNPYNGELHRVLFNEKKGRRGKSLSSCDRPGSLLLNNHKAAAESKTKQEDPLVQAPETILTDQEIKHQKREGGPTPSHCRIWFRLTQLPSLHLSHGREAAPSTSLQGGTARGRQAAGTFSERVRCILPRDESGCRSARHGHTQTPG